MTSPPLDFEANDSGRLAVASSDALRELRRDVFLAVGPAYGKGILYGIGFSEGLVDALHVIRAFDADAGPRDPARLAGPGLPLLFEPAALSGPRGFQGRLRNPIEAHVHGHCFPDALDPVCFVSAGYAAGWYTELLGTPVLVKEIECWGCGHERCLFEARPLREWVEDGDGAIRELLPYLDVEALRERARSSLPDASCSGEEETPRFDPRSPAVHVWGPVMILPYSGAADCSAAIDTIVGDVGAGEVRVVLVDLLGMRLDPIEAAGLTQVLAHLREQQMESILVGLSSTEGHRLGVPVSSTLCVPDMAHGIALGFQMVQSSFS